MNLSRKISNNKGYIRNFEYMLMKLRATEKIWHENPGNHNQFHFFFWLQQKKSIEVFVNNLELII